MMRTNPWAPLLLSVMALAACSSSADRPDAGTGGLDGSGGAGGLVHPGGANGPGGDGGDGGSGGVPHLGSEGLFACNLAPDCGELTIHLGNESPEVRACNAKLVLSGQPGVIVEIEAPGPNLDETATLIVLLGDGTGLVQTRERHCNFQTMDCSGAVPWEPATEQLICNVVVPPELAAACESDAPACSWTHAGALDDCISLDDKTCSEVDAILTGR
jgi:hypothetical protein